MNKNCQPICSNTFYHIYNRGNNHEKIFYTENNYYYFLKKYDEYLSSFLDTFTYCLIPNHFHFLIRTHNESDLISDQFRKFFITYSQAINKQENRSGSLFLKPFRRKPITGINYLQRIIYYIHNNPVHHGLCNRFEDYKWSSFNSILCSSKTHLKREEVIGLFGSKENFSEFHNSMQDFSRKEIICLEFSMDAISDGIHMTRK